MVSAAGLFIYFDPEAMQQVFINLFLNAVESMGNRGRLIIDVYEIGNGQPIGIGENKLNLKEIKSIYSAPGMQVIIKDTGYGIKQEHLEKIFEPYFTTKYRSTGLGLYITHQIVNAHKGKMDIYSDEGLGTSCVITLPRRRIK